MSPDLKVPIAYAPCRGDSVTVAEYEAADPRPGTLACPECQKPLGYRREVDVGVTHRRAHFFHASPLTGVCADGGRSAARTAFAKASGFEDRFYMADAHRRVIRAINDSLFEQGYIGQFEHTLLVGRRLDLLVDLDGVQFGIEVQKSEISLEEIERRNVDHLIGGVHETLWVGVRTRGGGQYPKGLRDYADKGGLFLGVTVSDEDFSARWFCGSKLKLMNSVDALSDVDWSNVLTFLRSTQADLVEQRREQEALRREAEEARLRKEEEARRKRAAELDAAAQVKIDLHKESFGRFFDTGWKKAENNRRVKRAFVPVRNRAGYLTKRERSVHIWKKDSTWHLERFQSWCEGGVWTLRPYGILGPQTFTSRKQALWEAFKFMDPEALVGFDMVA